MSRAFRAWFHRATLLPLERIEGSFDEPRQPGAPLRARSSSLLAAACRLQPQPVRPLPLSPTPPTAPKSAARRRHPAYQGRRLGQPRLSATATRRRRTTCARSPTPSSPIAASAPPGSARTRARPPARPSASRATSTPISSFASSTINAAVERYRVGAAGRAAKPDRRLRGRLQPLSRAISTPAASRTRTRPAGASRGSSEITADDVYQRLIAANLARRLGALRAADRERAAAARAVAPRATPPRRARRSTRNDARASTSARRPASAATRSRSARRSRTTTRSLLFGNPHWFWRGPDRFYQAQLTIPGSRERGGRVVSRRAADRARLQRQRRVDAHGVDRAALRHLPVDARSRRPDALPRRRPRRTDDARAAHGADAPSRRLASNRSRARCTGRASGRSSICRRWRRGSAGPRSARSPCAT